MSGIKKAIIILLSFSAILLFLYTAFYLFLEITGVADKARLGNHFAQARGLYFDLSLIYMKENNGAFPGSEAQLYAQGFIRIKHDSDNVPYVEALRYGNGYCNKDIFSDYQLLYGATVNDIVEDGDILRDKVTRKPILLINGPDMGYPKEAYEGYNQISNYIFGAIPKRKGSNQTISKTTHPRTKLHDAAEQGDLSQVQSLLTQGADVNVKDTGLFTPLHGAVTYGYEDVVRELIDHGADVNARDTGGYTPLYVAVVRDYAKIAEILIQRGAEINAKNNSSRTPIVEALVLGHEQVAEILMKHGAANGG